MTLTEARKILDKTRDGDDLPEEVVTEALEWTEDLDVYTQGCEAVEAYVDKMRKEGVL